MMVQERPLDIDCKRLSPGEFFVLKAPSLFLLPRVISESFFSIFGLSFVFFRPVQVQKGEADPGDVPEQKLQLR